MKLRSNLILAAKLTLIPVTLFYQVACSPVKFEKESPAPDCSSNGTCVVSPEFIDYSETIKVSGAKVDILFVNDNSGSMSFEQRRLADRFDTFIQALDLKSVDYRIGMITTDVSNTSVTSSSSLYNNPRAINKNGALQDGKLISFKTASEELANQAGVTYLTPSSASKLERFANTVSRKETLQCENFMSSNSTTSTNYEANRRANCPSGDERGIAAANLFIRNQSQNLLRSDAQLAIVFLSDEDVNSGAYFKASLYKLSSDDVPTAIVTNLASKFPGKQLSMHSIIVKPGELNSNTTASQLVQVLRSTVSNSLRPEATYYSGADSSCLSQQSNQTRTQNGQAMTGSYGFMYDLASRLTGGIVGDICANDYGSQLDAIGRDIGDRVDQIVLKCDQPLNLDLEFSPASSARPYNLNGSRIEFSSDLTVGTQVKVAYSCRRSG